MYNKKYDVIIISYQGSINERNSRLLRDTIVHQVHTNDDLNFKRILVSLKDVKYENNSNSISIVVEQLDKLSHEMKILCGFFDYSLDLYPVLKKATKNIK